MSGLADQKRHSVDYLLNRERRSKAEEIPVERTSNVAKPSNEHAASDASASNRPQGTQTFAFVNISDPTQSGDADNRKFVRQYVRPVKRTKEEPSHVTPTAAVGLESGALPFIVMSHPDQGSTAGTRKFVKQNAQRRFRKAKARKPMAEEQDEEDETEAITTPSVPFGQEWANSPQLEDVKSQLGIKGKLTINLHRPRNKHPPTTRKSDDKQTPPVKIDVWNHVDSSGAIFPVKMDSDTYRLVEYLHTSSRTTKVPPAFMPLWFGLILNDPTAFNGLMSLALGQQYRCHRIPTEQKFILYHTKALNAVQRRLSQPTAPTDFGLLTSIILFLMHDILLDDYEHYAINRAGLRTIINIRGGIETLDNFFEQRVFVIVAEVCGALSFNFLPEYYLPHFLLQAPPRVSSIPMASRLRWLVKTWLEHFPERTEVVRNFGDLHAVNAEVVLDCPNIWKRPAALSPEIYTVIIRFLHLVNHVKPDQKGAQVEISLCMASILYCNILRDALGDYFTRLDHGLIERLMIAVLPDSIDWINLESMRLWCLVQGGIVSSGKDRMKILEKTREVMRHLSCRDWDDAIGIVVEIVYVEQLFGKKCREFGEEIMAEWV